MKKVEEKNKKSKIYDAFDFFCVLLSVTFEVIMKGARVGLKMTSQIEKILDEKRVMSD